MRGYQPRRAQQEEVGRRDALDKSTARKQELPVAGVYLINLRKRGALEKREAVILIGFNA